MTDFADLVVARSNVTILTGIYDSLAADGVTVEGLQEESMLRALPAIFAQLEADAEETRVNLTYAAFPSGAVQLTTAPDWMYLHATDFFQVTPLEALETLGTMRITATASASSSTIGTGKLVVRYGAGSAQKLYTNTEAFAPVPGSYVNVPMTAQVAGAGGNIGNNATLYLVTAYPGLSATNPPVSGTQTWITRRGRDTEALVSIKARCDARWADLSFGVSSARFARIIADAFETAEQTNPITRIYVDDANPDGPGSVWVYMARDSIPATGDDIALVDAYITPRWQAGGGPFASKAASVQSITIDGDIKGPTNEAAALVQVSAVLAALAPTYSLGGAIVYAEQVRSALMMGVTGALNVTLSLDEETAISAGSIVEFTIGTITITP